MRAIEINSKTDKTGHLKINYRLDKSDRNVRILILLDEEKSNMDAGKLWLDSISKNPALGLIK